MRKLLFIILFSFVTANAQQNIRIIDGDTFVLNEERIRIFGIDSPELKQDYGIESKNTLTKLLTGKTIKTTLVNKDRYGRSVCKVYANGKDVAIEMLKLGSTSVYKYYCNDKLYLSEESRSKRLKRGLFGLKTYISPYEFRKRKY